MNRRTLFGRLATVAAAATVAAHVEPARGEANSGCGYRYADGDLCVLDTAVHDYDAHVGHERWMHGAAERQQQTEMARSKLVTRRETPAFQIMNTAQTTPILEFKRDENGTPMIVVPLAVRAQPNGFAYRVGHCNE